MLKVRLCQLISHSRELLLILHFLQILSVRLVKVEISEVLRRILLWHFHIVSITRCRNSTQCIDKNVSLSVVCKSPANGGRFARIALKSFEIYSPNSFSIFFMTSVLMVENSDLS